MDLHDGLPWRGTDLRLPHPDAIPSNRPCWLLEMSAFSLLFPDHADHVPSEMCKACKEVLGKEPLGADHPG